MSENCVITSKAIRESDPDADPAVAGINIQQIYVPVVILSAENDNKISEQ